MTEQLGVGGKSFGFVGIDIECKNTSISGDIGGLKMSYQIVRIRENGNVLF